MIGRLKIMLHDMLRRVDLEVHRHSNSDRFLRRKLLDQHRISVVLDVGANQGQYGEELRATGYRGRIVSFEPLAMC